MKRRAADLTQQFRRLIARQGPITLAQYMGESNAHYYAQQDPFGGEGDFITAPEITQIFGELIGLWLTDIWNAAGREHPVYYVELGPGRGTLAQDALRAARAFGLEAQPHLVENSPFLRGLQRAAVPGCIHHDDLSTVPQDAPILLVANEFFDALPIHQLVKTAEGWRERMVGLSEAVTPEEGPKVAAAHEVAAHFTANADKNASGEGKVGPNAQEQKFAFVAGHQPMTAAVPQQFQNAQCGSIAETSPASAAIMREIAQRLNAQGGAALIIDYGFTQPQLGSTFQAVRAHQSCEALSHPGAVDLTAHVDFAMLGEIARSQGARHIGTMEQGAWLRAMGVAERGAALAAKPSLRAAPDPNLTTSNLNTPPSPDLNTPSGPTRSPPLNSLTQPGSPTSNPSGPPEHGDPAEQIQRAIHRLTAPDQMGALFKVMGLSSGEGAKGKAWGGGVWPGAA